MKSRHLFAITLAAASLAASAATPELLDIRQAFQVAASFPGEAIDIRFRIADGYYLYRDKIRIDVEPDNARAGKTRLPRGTIKVDEFFGRNQVFRGEVSVRIPLRPSRTLETVVLKVRTQGCADVGVCYPPREEVLTMTRGDRERTAEGTPGRKGSLLDQLADPVPSPSR